MKMRKVYSYIVEKIVSKETLLLYNIKNNRALYV